MLAWILLLALILIFACIGISPIIVLILIPVGVFTWYYIGEAKKKKALKEENKSSSSNDSAPIESKDIEKDGHSQP